MGSVHEIDVDSTHLRKTASAVTKEIKLVALDQDTLALARAGKRQVLKRRFGLFSMIGLGISLTCTWEGMLVGLSIGLLNGGPSCLLYSAIFAWIGTMSVMAALGELSSMMPTAAGQYHWACLMAPVSIRKISSYIAGWLTVITWIVAPAGGTFFCATLTQQLVAMAVPTYQPKSWQSLLMQYAYLILAAIFNTHLGVLMPFMQLIFMSLHVLGYFAFLIPLVYLAPHNSAKEVFTTTNNGGGWATLGLSFMVSMQGNGAPLLGGDGAIHMSEETFLSNMNVARSMLFSTAVEGVMGFSMLLAFLFCAGPLEELAKTQSEYPVIDILRSGTGSQTAATVLTAVLLIMSFFGTVSAMSSSSRMIWSFARDRGLPFWPVLIKLGRKNNIPTKAVIAVALIGACIGLIQLGSTTAVSQIQSLVIEGWYMSYLCVVAPLLYHRIKGNIAERPGPGGDPYDSFGSEKGKPFQWGPWRIRGIWGTLNNAFACAYLVTVGFFCYWPAYAHPTTGNMNYAPAIIGGVVIVGAVYYLLWGHKTYDGPVVEVVVREGRIENISPTSHLSLEKQNS